MYFICIFRPNLTNADSFIWIRAEKDAIEDLAGMYREDMRGRSTGVSGVRRGDEDHQFYNRGVGNFGRSLSILIFGRRSFPRDQPGQGLISEDSAVVREPFCPIVRFMILGNWENSVTLWIEVDDKAPVYLNVLESKGFHRKSPLCRNNTSLGLSVLVAARHRVCFLWKVTTVSKSNTCD